MYDDSIWFDFKLHLIASFDYGPAHIVAISTEVYFFTNQGRRLITEQLLWLKEDFKVT